MSCPRCMDSVGIRIWGSDVVGGIRSKQVTLPLLNEAFLVRFNASPQARVQRALKCATWPWHCYSQV